MQITFNCPSCSCEMGIVDFTVHDCEIFYCLDCHTEYMLKVKSGACSNCPERLECLGIPISLIKAG